MQRGSDRRKDILALTLTLTVTLTVKLALALTLTVTHRCKGMVQERV